MQLQFYVQVNDGFQGSGNTFSLPVNTESTKVQNCDPHRGLLEEWHQLAEVQPKWAVIEGEPRC